MIARSLRLTAVPSALRAACAPSASSSAPAAAGALVAARHKSAEALSYTERQALKGRPISPHVMIYAFPIVALSSITVRVTGALLAVGTSGIGIMALAGGASRRGHAASAVVTAAVAAGLPRTCLLKAARWRRRWGTSGASPHDTCNADRLDLLPPALPPSPAPPLSLSLSLSLAGDPAALMTVLAGSSIAPLAKFAVAFPFTYHFMGGVRHVIWDRNPEMLTNAGVEQASFAIFGAATAASVGAAIYTAD